MRSPAAQLLETALALQRAPGERFRLRERPLRPGLVHVMEVASGSPQALSVAAQDLGEDESILLEAARFYLEQVLFAAPDADAYRILGVPPDAPTELIRTHHRWLQRWLHPDRAQAGDSAVYATRVNQAWATLRNPESRHQYDVRLAEARLAGSSAPLPAATVRRWEHDEPVAGASGGRARYLLAAALAACIVLAVLVVRHEQGPQPWVSDAPEARTVAVASPAPVPDDIEAVSRAFAAAIAIPASEARATRPPAPVEPTHGRLASRQTRTVAGGPTPEVGVKPHVPTVQAAVPPARPPVRVAQAASRSERPAESAAQPERLPARPPVAAAEVPTRPAEPSYPDTPTPVPDTTLQEDTTLLLTRMELAQQRYSELAAYLAARSGAAPAWSDLEARNAADRVRQQMNVRGNVMFAPPNWQLHLDRARLNVDYQCPKCGVPRGRLDVHLVWRDGLWQVGSIDLAPAA